jgi:hypothetical protein
MINVTRVIKRIQIRRDGCTMVTLHVKVVHLPGNVAALTHLRVRFF